MRAVHLTLALALFVSAPALADDAVRAADQRVEQTGKQLAAAVHTGDAVTIADAKAKHDAAQAVAWGRRHPAKQPSPAAVAARQ